MGKVIHNDVFDAALNEIADNADIMYVNSAEPATFVEASSTYKLADVAMVVGDGNDYTVGDDPTNGRRLTMDEKATVDIDASGTANHVSLADVGNTKVLAVVTLSASQALTSGNTVTIPTWYLRLADPT